MKQVAFILLFILALAAAVHWDGPNRSLTVTKTDHQIAVRAVKTGGGLPRNVRKSAWKRQVVLSTLPMAELE